jgi:hypothetical protein
VVDSQLLCKRAQRETGIPPHGCAQAFAEQGGNVKSRCRILCIGGSGSFHGASLVKNDPNSNDFVPKVGQVLAPLLSGTAAENQVDRKRDDTFQRR